MTNLKNQLLLLLAGCSISVTASAISTHIVVHDKEGAHHRIELAAGMHLRFDGSYLIIGDSTAGTAYNIEDVAKLTYDIPTGINDTYSNCRYVFSTDGLTLTMSETDGGNRNHYRIHTLSGTTVAQGDFADRCFIPARELPKGVVIILVNESDKIKILVSGY